MSSNFFDEQSFFLSITRLSKNLKDLITSELIGPLFRQNHSIYFQHFSKVDASNIFLKGKIGLEKWRKIKFLVKRLFKSFYNKKFLGKIDSEKNEKEINRIEDTKLDINNENADIKLIKENKVEEERETLSLKKAKHLQTSFDNPIVILAKEETNEIDLGMATRHIPVWGGEIIIDVRDFLNYEDYENAISFDEFRISNSCSIDYFLFSLWLAAKLSSNFLKTIYKYNDIYFYINSIVDCIEKREWKRAKTIWILSVMKKKPSENWFGFFFDLFDNEYETYIKYMVPFQQVEWFDSVCLKELCHNQSNFHLIQDDDNQFFINVNLLENCNECNNIYAAKFIKNPFMLIAEVGTNISIKEIPLSIKINNYSFRLLMMTIHINGHFKAIYRFNNKFFLVDDQTQGLSQEIPDMPIINSIIYIIE